MNRRPAFEWPYNKTPLALIGEYSQPPGLYKSGKDAVMNTESDIVQDATAEAWEKFEFCAKSANTPLAIESVAPLGMRSILIEGYWRPEDGHILDLLTIGWRRHFWGFRADVNLSSEEDGYYRFNARMTLRHE